MLRSAIAHTLPPRPPSPPSGPPRGTYFSRRKLATPLPPSPAITSIFASSMNFMLFGPSSRDPLVQTEQFAVVTRAVALPDDAPIAFGRGRRIVAAAALVEQQRAAQVRFRFDPFGFHAD